MSLRQLATTAVHPVWWLRKTNLKKHMYVNSRCFFKLKGTLDSHCQNFYISVGKIWSKDMHTWLLFPFQYHRESIHRKVLNFSSVGLLRRRQHLLLITVHSFITDHVRSTREGKVFPFSVHLFTGGWGGGGLPGQVGREEQVRRVALPYPIHLSPSLQYAFPPTSPNQSPCPTPTLPSPN